MLGQVIIEHVYKPDLIGTTARLFRFGRAAISEIGLRCVMLGGGIPSRVAAAAPQSTGCESGWAPLSRMTSRGPVLGQGICGQPQKVLNVDFRRIHLPATRVPTGRCSRARRIERGLFACHWDRAAATSASLWGSISWRLGAAIAHLHQVA